MIKALTMTFAVMLATSTIANATPRHSHRSNQETTNCYANPNCSPYGGETQVVTRTGRTYAYDGTVLPHPAGCPRRLFCGCGVAVKVFGEPRRDLWPASAWLRFARTTAGPGMVVVWNHHVAYIESVDSNGNAVLYDPNGGRGLTWRHTRSIRGLPVVDPHRPRYASR